MDETVFGLLDRLDKGSVSDMEATADKGLLVYAADRSRPWPTSPTRSTRRFRPQLADSFARTDTTSALREVLEAELNAAEP